jgi:acetyl esterase/lipase
MTLLLIYAILALQDSPTPKEFEVEIENDQAYGEASKKQKLDLYVPKDKGDAPVLMFVHGGTWKSGDRKWYIEFGKTFAKKGLITAVLSYRLSPAVKHPSHIEDVAKAFAWLKKKFASNKLYVMGHSAGGHLVALLATNEKYLKAEGCAAKDITGVIGISGVYHILPDAKVLPEVFTDNPETRKDASPSDFIREGLPKFCLFYASKEMALLDSSAKEFHKGLEGKKVETELHVVENRDHISIITNCGKPEDDMTKRILEFVK